MKLQNLKSLGLQNKVGRRNYKTNKLKLLPCTQKIREIGGKCRKFESVKNFEGGRKEN